MKLLVLFAISIGVALGTDAPTGAPTLPVCVIDSDCGTGECVDNYCICEFPTSGLHCGDPGTACESCLN
jgi:hypothetical protein